MCVIRTVKRDLIHKFMPSVPNNIKKNPLPGIFLSSASIDTKIDGPWIFREGRTETLKIAPFSLMLLFC